MRPDGAYVESAWRYQADVLDGTIPACKWVRLACARNQRDLERAAQGDGPWVFDVRAAERVCAACEQFPHVKGPKAKLVWSPAAQRWRWQTLALEPWQCWVVCVAFGWLSREDGLRRFQRMLVMVPRKNAKTTLLSALCLYMLTADGEIGADVVSAATKKDQARIVYGIASTMARRSPDFTSYFGVVVMETSIKVEATGSKFEPLSADDKTLDGLNPSFATLDELQAHRTRGVWDVLVTALASRAQPMLAAIATAGTNIGGICYEVMTYAQRVLEQSLAFGDDQFFGVIYTIDEEDRDHWDTESVLRKANPNWGVSVNPRTLLADAQQAKRSQAAINNFLCKHLNVWVRSVSPWMPLEAWAACANPRLTLDTFAGATRVVITVDLAETRDIASIVVVGLFPDGVMRAVAKHFYPEAAIEASPVAQMGGWVQSGALISTPGDIQDFSRLEDEIAVLVDRVHAHRVAFDRAMAAYMMQRLQQRLGQDVVGIVTQNIKTFNPAMKDLLGRVHARTFEHTGDPVLTWMVSNVGEKKTHLEESYPVKANGKDSPEKIDGAVALLMADSELLREEPPEPTYQLLVLGPESRSFT